MSMTKRNNGWFIHLAIWTVVLMTPFFSPQPGRPLHGGLDYSRFIPVVLSFVVVFYVNYLYLIKKYLSARRTGLFILLNIGLIAVVSVLVPLFFRVFFVPAGGPPPPRQLLDRVSFIARNTVIYAAIVGIAVAVRMTSEWYRNEARRKEIEKAGAEAELANLKSQVNPHFLFNTLNNIYSLIQIDPAQAQEAVHDLSGMLRYVLYESRTATVPLSKECGFINEYVKLMSARLSSGVSLEVSLPDATSSTQVAPLLFIPLVENAFKHGVSGTEPSFIRITISEKPGAVECLVENSCFPKDDTDRSGSGIGIANLKRRLEMLYPGRHSFEYGRVQSTYRSLLRLRTGEAED